MTLLLFLLTIISKTLVCQEFTYEKGVMILTDENYINAIE